jgi:hypothetical protein
MMDKQLQKYYENRLEMTASEAWKDLMLDLEGMISATDTLSGVTPDTLRFKQGELSIMRWLQSIADTSRKAYEQLRGEDADDA